MKHYFTFGQSHAHKVDDKIFDKDCVAVINADTHGEARDIAFEYFGPYWCVSYEEDRFTEDKMQFFPRGFIEVNPPEEKEE